MTGHESQSSAVVLTAADVRARLPAIDVRSAVRDAFLELAAGTAVQPDQSLIPLANGGDLILYPAALQRKGVVAVKASPYRPGRDPAVTAWTLLISLETGDPLLICDAMALTTERTGATTALAVDALAPSDAATLAVVGSGALARAHLRHVGRLRAFSDIRVFSPRLADGDRQRLTALAADCPQARVVARVDDAVADADVVLLCTSSATPVVCVDHLAPGALVSSITTNAPQAHEIAPDALHSMAVYCDSRHVAPRWAAEMRLAQQSGWEPQSIVADLAELVAGRAPPRPEGRAFFRSVGLGVEDAAVAAALFDAVRGHGEARSG